MQSRPPWGLRRLGLTCLYTRLTPSATTLWTEGSTRSTRRARPSSASSPEITCTMSSLRTCIAGPSLDDLGRQADDLGEAALAQLPGHGAEDARAARVLLVVDQHQGVAVE